MSNGNGVKSVSLADGTLSPDLRVNYNFGLVLGVNEFKQEQEYFLQRDYLYNRAFEGYGTISGLRVTVEWLKGEDVQITVGSGMAIDQFGRPIVIREAQCARLVAWLKRQEEKKKGIIEDHRPEGRKKKKEEHERREEREEEYREHRTSGQHQHAEQKSTAKAHAEPAQQQQAEKKGSGKAHVEQAQYQQAKKKDAGKAHTEPAAHKQEEKQRAAGKHRHEGKKRLTEERDIDEYYDEEEEKRDLRVYIIARYDDYPVGQVPIAGQACNTGDTDPIYSRIHDSYNIDFSWDPPTMPAWESVRCFAKMMARVRIKADAGRDDTDEIIERMRKLDEPDSILLCAPPKKRDDDDEDDEERNPRWFIPADQARTALDHIFTTWVTEVRPKLLPGLLDPAQAGTKAQPDILLAHIDFTLDDDWDDKDPKIEEDGFDPPDNSGRPYLLSTQVVQEMLLLGHRESQSVDGGGDALPVREFATIQVRNSHTLYAWVHHPRPLEIESDKGDWSELLEVRSDGQPLKISHVKEREPNVFEIRVRAAEEQEGEGVLMVPGARVELVFKVDEIPVERTDDDDQDDEDGNEDEGEHKKSGDLGGEVDEGLKEVGEAVEDVVSGAGDVIKEVAGGIEWVAGGLIEDVGESIEEIEHVLGIGKGHKTVGEKVEHVGKEAEQEGDELINEAQADEKRLDREEDTKGGEEKSEKEEHELSLARSIRKRSLNYVGYDYEQKAIIVYTIASHMPVRELVTFFTYDQRSDMANVPHEELKKVTTAEHFLALWFHTYDPVRLPERVHGWRAFINQQPQELVFKALAPGKQTFSHFWALEPEGSNGTLRLEPGELLTVSFNTHEIGVGGEDAVESLTESMKEEPFTCVGYDGNHTIEVHHQVSPSHGRSEDEEPTITDKLAASQRAAEADRAMPPVQPFVTITVTRLSQSAEGGVEAHLELWFHLSTNVEQDRVGFTENLSFDVLLEEGRRMETVQVQATPPTRVQHNVYTSVVAMPQPHQDQRGYYLRLRFRLDQNEVNVRGVKAFYQNLGDYIRGTGIRFEGYNGENAIIAYVRAAAPR